MSVAVGRTMGGCGSGRDCRWVWQWEGLWVGMVVGGTAGGCGSGKDYG